MSRNYSRRRLGLVPTLLIFGVVLIVIGVNEYRINGSPFKGGPPQQIAVNSLGSEKFASSEILADLGKLAVKGRAPKTGYSRDQFGKDWTETDGCDTRNIILKRDLTDISLDSDGCKVDSGVLNDPYTGKVINFIKGDQTSSAVQIDHVVALGDSWQKGAALMSPSTRLAFANDPLELLAVDGPTNDNKGDGDAATWLPPNKSDRCNYVAKQILVKQKYSLWVTSAEHDAMANVLSTCTGQTLSVSD